MFGKAAYGPAVGVFVAQDGTLTLDLGVGGGSAGGGFTCITNTSCIGGSE